MSIIEVLLGKYVAMFIQNMERFWKYDVGNYKSIVGYVQTLIDKTAPGLEGTAGVTYPVHVVGLNFSRNC